MIADYGKLAMLALLVIVGAILAGTHIIPGDAADKLLIATFGYLTGNGVLARTKQAPSPVLAPRTLDEAD